jgi:hypothetical protein
VAADLTDAAQARAVVGMEVVVHAAAIHPEAYTDDQPDCNVRRCIMC